MNALGPLGDRYHWGGPLDPQCFHLWPRGTEMNTGRARAELWKEFHLVREQSEKFVWLWSGPLSPPPRPPPPQPVFFFFYRMVIIACAYKRLLVGLEIMYVLCLALTGAALFRICLLAEP